MPRPARARAGAPLHTSLPGITAGGTGGIVVGIVVFGDSISRAPGPLLEASGLIALLIGVILVARSQALSRRHRSRPPRV
jgi:hypothetical protein